MYPLYDMTSWGKYGGTYNPQEGSKSEYQGAKGYERSNYGYEIHPGRKKR